VKGLDRRDIALVVAAAGMNYFGAAAVHLNFRMDIETGYLLQVQIAVEACSLGIEPENVTKIGKALTIWIADQLQIIRMTESLVAS
jgi:hypothetical protein